MFTPKFELVDLQSHARCDHMAIVPLGAEEDWGVLKHNRSTYGGLKCPTNTNATLSYNYIGAVNGGPASENVCERVDATGIANHALFECVPPGEHEIRLYRSGSTTGWRKPVWRRKLTITAATTTTTASTTTIDCTTARDDPTFACPAYKARNGCDGVVDRCLVTCYCAALAPPTNAPSAAPVSPTPNPEGATTNGPTPQKTQKQPSTASVSSIVPATTAALKLQVNATPTAPSKEGDEEEDDSATVVVVVVLLVVGLLVVAGFLVYRQTASSRGDVLANPVYVGADHTGRGAAPTKAGNKPRTVHNPAYDLGVSGTDATLYTTTVAEETGTQAQDLTSYEDHEGEGEGDAPGTLYANEQENDYAAINEQKDGNDYEGTRYTDEQDASADSQTQSYEEAAQQYAEIDSAANTNA